jgi:ABC-type transporter Mla MlaB component
MENKTKQLMLFSPIDNVTVHPLWLQLTERINSIILSELKQVRKINWRQS